MGGGGMLPRSIGGAAGMLGLEMPLLNAHPQQQQQQQQYMSPFQQPQNQQLAGHHSSLRQSSYASYGVRGRQQQAQHSPEGEPEFREGSGAGDHGAAKRGGASLTSQSPCPWTRMKWTDSMVRLLISVVGANTRGGGAASASASASASQQQQQQQQQKKGKWKSVSRAMMEKGFCVSPQQCEDKFNDLNKRYKRVIDLLGKGTACRVVENPSLLDTMDHLPTKAREEARKLLSSKHLFFPEMCAYHNAGSANPSCAAGPPAAPAAQPSRMPSLPQLSDRQTSCFHHPAGPGASREEEAIGKAAAAGANDGRHHQPAEEDEDEDEGEGEDNDADEDRSNNEEEEEDDDDDDDDDRLADDDPLEDDRNEEDRGGDVEDMKAFVTASKRQKRTPRLSLSLQSSTTASARLQELRSELMGMAAAAAAAGEGGGGAMMQWVRRRAAELEEQRVGYQCRAFQLERQRFKWLRFSTNKEREMERMKLDNDRLRLDNDRMLLLLRQKELELLSTTASAAAGGHAAAASSTDHHHFLNHHKQQE
uniref:Myb/SANT-like DNA-binding domain-containing protein n=1 Tax=Ananas comosus var. bracteatus TaxID=296719 RepID=A0A6V7Q130_ANACO|nr:unnamed protein product [Ananas comosus var. bracteatus]